MPQCGDGQTLSTSCHQEDHHIRALRNFNGAIAVNLHNDGHQAPTTAPVPPLPLLWVSTKGTSVPEAIGRHIEVEATHPRQTGCCIQLETRNIVTSTGLSAHHMPGSAKDHLTANDNSSCQGHKAGLCDAVVACILPGQGSRPSWSTEVTADNGATVGSEQPVEINAENGNKLPGSGQVHTCLQGGQQGRVGQGRAGQDMFQQHKLGNLNLGKSGQHQGRFHRHPPEPAFPVLSLPGGP